jgi:L-serine dehydratase
MVSPFELFSVGIGPSSSHTVGPMRAARAFATRAVEQAGGAIRRVEVRLFGSLALTGRGHGTDVAVILGLLGHEPESVDADAVADYVSAVRADGDIHLCGKVLVEFVPDRDIVFARKERLPGHSNALRLVAVDADAEVLLEETWYSVGGGFIVREGDPVPRPETRAPLPYPFDDARQLLTIAEQNGLSIAQIVAENEGSRDAPEAIASRLLEIWGVMQDCVSRGLRHEGMLPGGLRVPRRAPALHRRLTDGVRSDGLVAMDWLNLWALAVNEENAAGGRVVTAPTNGAAGIIPAVLHYYVRFVEDASDDGIVEFLLTATAIGSVIKSNASISGAEVGCQGEVGSASAMAAAGLAAVLGGSAVQVENAAEIALEHNLGLTCDPVGGLVQIPCIERNAVASAGAVNAARMALHGDGTHKVSLDQAIAALRQTGADMHSKYKETAEGGLAVAVVEC